MPNTKKYKCLKSQNRIRVCALPLDAVGGREDISVTDESTSAVEVSLIHDCHHPGIFVKLGEAATYHAHAPIGQTTRCRDDQRCDQPQEGARGYGWRGRKELLG